MNISKLSVNRPTLVVVVFTVLLFLGFAGYKSLKYELLPPMTAPAFVVTAVYPGASPSEVENDVTKNWRKSYRRLRISTTSSPPHTKEFPLLVFR